MRAAAELRPTLRLRSGQASRRRLSLHMLSSAGVFSDSADVSSVSKSSAPAHASEAPKGIKLRYVARQPIFDRDQKVFGYELLFRDDMENVFHEVDANTASRSTVDNSLLVGLDVLCDGRRAFLNCTRDTLIGGLLTLMPSHSTVIEILESVPVDPEVLNACQHLKEAGYMIALDDFVSGDPREPLAEMADILKVHHDRATCRTNKKARTVAVSHAGGKSGESRRLRFRQRARFCLFPGVFPAPSGNDDDARCPTQLPKLCANATGGFPGRS
jgi:hypothetical protein